MTQPDQRQPRGTGIQIPVRSVRVKDELWERFVRRALTESPPRTASAVLHRFIQDYADGFLSLPRMHPLYEDEVIIDLRDFDPDAPQDWDTVPE